MASEVGLLAIGSALTLAGQLVTSAVSARQAKRQAEEETQRVALQVEAERERVAEEERAAHRAKMEPLLEEAGIALDNADRVLLSAAVLAPNGKAPSEPSMDDALGETRRLLVLLRLRLPDHHPLVMVYKRGVYALAIGDYYARRIQRATVEGLPFPADEKWEDQLSGARKEVSDALTEFFGITASTTGVELPAEPYDYDAAATALTLATLKEKPRD